MSPKLIWLAGLLSSSSGSVDLSEDGSVQVEIRSVHGEAVRKAKKIAGVGQISKTAKGVSILRVKDPTEVQAALLSLLPELAGRRAEEAEEALRALAETRLEHSGC